MFVDKWRVLVTAAIVLAVYFLDSALFSEAIYAAFWLLISFFFAGFLTKIVRRYAVKRLIAFDFSGVLATGNPLLEDLKEDQKMFDLVKRLRKKYRVALWSDVAFAAIDYLEKRYKIKERFDCVVYPKMVKTKKSRQGFL